MASTFHDAEIASASDAEISAWLARVAPTRARLEIGSLLLAPEIPFALDAGGFDRHTFLCGQSGSGKSYALGALLEQVVQETGLRIIILDPNSDFVRFASVKADASEEAASRWLAAASGVVVRQSAEAGDKRLRLRFADLDTRTRGAMLRIDPIADADRGEALGSPGARPRRAAGFGGRRRRRRYGLGRRPAWIARGAEGREIPALCSGARRPASPSVLGWRGGVSLR